MDNNGSWRGHPGKYLIGYLHDELDTHTKTLIRSHLNSCEKCKNEYDSFQRGVNVLYNIDDVHTPPELWQRIENELQNSKVQRASKNNKHIKNLFFSDDFYQKYRLALSISFAVLVFVVLILFMHPQQFEANTVIDLETYLDTIESIDLEVEGYDAFYLSVSGFTAVDRAEILRLIDFEIEEFRLPSGIFKLVESSRKSSKKHEVYHLVYSDEQSAFSVFVAPQSIGYSFGNREITGGSIRGIQCKIVDCPNLSTVLFDANGKHIVIVSKESDTEFIYPIIERFRSI